MEPLYKLLLKHTATTFEPSCSSVVEQLVRTTIMLNRLSITTFLALLLVSSFSPPSNEGISISISNLRNDKGHVLVSLFREGEGFPDQPGKAFRKEKLIINNKKAVIHLAAIPTGNYAIAILHDENNDTKMNTNWLGLPKEGYGFSNNVMGKLGPPVYSRASFKHLGGKLTLIEIRTRY